MMQCERCSRGPTATNKDQTCSHAVAKYINCRGPQFTPADVCLRVGVAGRAAKGLWSPLPRCNVRERALWHPLRPRQPTSGDCDESSERSEMEVRLYVGGHGGVGTWTRGTDLFGFPLSFSFIFFLWRLGEAEAREPQYGDRTQHGFAGECWTGTGFGKTRYDR